MVNQSLSESHLSTIASQSRKRIKHVVSSGQVPHLWFHRTQDSARNSGRSLYFENETIYSYGSHFPIARHVESIKKRQAVLFTTRSHSVTTSQHCSAVRSAIPSDTLIFHVPNVFTDDRYASNDHERNLADYVKRIESAIVTSARGRSSWTKQSNHTDAVNLTAEVKAYAAFFQLKLPKLPSVPAFDSKEMQAIKTREAKNAAQKAEQTRIRREQEAELERTKIDRWRSGENVGSLYNVPVMLRINGEELETSRGARIPVSHAVRGLHFVRAIVARGEAFQTNGHKFHLGHYSIDRVDVDGTLHAGCHVISLAEIERIAPFLESLSIPEEVQS